MKNHTSKYGTASIAEKTTWLSISWPAGMVDAQPSFTFDLITHHNPSEEEWSMQQIPTRFRVKHATVT